MAQQIDNGFTTYEFTDEELITAATFNSLQKLYIQTRRAESAMDKVALKFNPEKVLEFSNAVAYCDGFIAACDYFLDHEAAEAAAVRWAELKAATQESKD